MTIPIKQHFAGLLAAFPEILLGHPAAWAQIKVACVADSITAGYALANPGAESDHAQLKVLLGSAYTCPVSRLSHESRQVSHFDDLAHCIHKKGRLASRIVGRNREAGAWIKRCAVPAWLASG